MSRRAKSASAQWRKRQENDPYVLAARAEGYRSRAAFKLLQINESDDILRPGMTAADLGAAPGGWTQVAAQLVRPDGIVVAADILPMSPVPGAVIVRGDFSEAENRAEIARALGGAADAVLSDLAPNLSGVPHADQARAAELAEIVAEFCRENLRPGGKILLKSFAPPEDIKRILHPLFDKIRVRHPKASRTRSSERFFVATRKSDIISES